MGTIKWFLERWMKHMGLGFLKTWDIRRQQHTVSLEDLSVKMLCANTCYFFARLGVTDSTFLALVADETYTRIQREHFNAGISDNGTWTQDHLGKVTLRSSWHSKQIEAGPLTIFLHYSGVENRWNVLEALLTNSLECHHHTAWPVKEMKQMFQAPSSHFSETCVHGLRIIQSEIDTIKVRLCLKESETTIPRQALEVFRLNIAQYSQNYTIQESHFVPLEYHHRVFLEWQRDEPPINRDRIRMMAEIDRLPRQAYPSFFFVQIPRKLFHSEAGHLQPFLVYTEMNQLRERNTGLQKEVSRIARYCNHKEEDVSEEKTLRVRYKLTEQSWEHLRKEGVPDTIIEHLAPLENRRFRKKRTFLQAVKRHLDDEHVIQYKTVIVEHAKILE